MAKKVSAINKTKNKLNSERISMLKAFCKRVNISFKNYELLDTAFHHRSLTNEKNLVNNERLEFLGDSVLGMVTAAYLFTNLENKEGDLAKIKSAVVSEKSLAPIALKFGIDKLLMLGLGEEKTGGRNKPAILADCMEAVIGAYYLDSGYKAAEKYVLEFIVPEINNVLVNGIGQRDYKSVLQEKTQKIFKNLPEYKLISREGPQHQQIFKVSAVVGGLEFGPCEAKSIKEAEQLAAQKALEYINKL